jgi:hypothetical protein
VEWSHWLLTNYSLNPGTIYSPPIPFTLEELTEMVSHPFDTCSQRAAHVQCLFEKLCAVSRDALCENDFSLSGAVNLLRSDKLLTVQASHNSSLLVTSAE